MKAIENFDSCFISTKGNTEPYIKIPNLNYSNDYIDYCQNQENKEKLEEITPWTI